MKKVNTLSAHHSKKENAKDLDLCPEEALQLAQELKEQLLKGDLQIVEMEKINLMISGLGDNRGLIRRAFAESLGEIGTAALPSLIKALKGNQNVIVRRAAAKTIKLVGDPSSLPHLLEALLNDKDPVVQGSSAGAMAIFGEEAIDHLITVLKNPYSSPMQCGLATWALEFIGANAPIGLIKAARSQHPAVRTAAIGAFGDLIQENDDTEAKIILLQAIEDPIPEVRIEATRVILNIKDKDQIKQILIKKLDDNELLVRKNAILSLIKLRSKDSIIYLKKRLLIESEESVLKILKLAIKLISKG